MEQEAGSPPEGSHGGPIGVLHKYLRHRYAILFYVLLVTMLTAPMLSSLNFEGTSIESLLAVCLLAAILPVGAVRNRPYLLVAFIVAGLARVVTAAFDYHAAVRVEPGNLDAYRIACCRSGIAFCNGRDSR